MDVLRVSVLSALSWHSLRLLGIVAELLIQEVASFAPASVVTSGVFVLLQGRPSHGGAGVVRSILLVLFLLLAALAPLTLLLLV